ncbi:hypothetical protein ACFQ3B_08680 [Stackebrandtia endophytica]|uniref:hypothetical protein n=1 Tax=Stackebrandtia endophytica TaxID=1496996 RepID=UPI001477275C|nr:hypothetical protein [Stackebrandtia endophytica]
MAAPNAPVGGVAFGGVLDAFGGVDAEPVPVLVPPLNAPLIVAPVPRPCRVRVHQDAT